MAVHKVMGIETEYGVMTRGMAEQNPIAASSVLVNSYVAAVAALGDSSGDGAAQPVWDYSDESPMADARDAARQFVPPPDAEPHLVNAVLTNGARFYVDHAHPEYSSPEVSDAMQGVLWDRAGEAVMIRAMAAVRERYGDVEVVVHKNNSDGKGNSYGCHENYICARSLPFADIIAGMTPHLVTRQVFCGAGKLGWEIPGSSGSAGRFQVSQRADFFEEEVGLETTLKRPIINTRDEPHADSQKYRRLHVIIGDANQSEHITFLKLGTTALVLCMVEDGWPLPPLTPKDPVATVRHISADTELAAPFVLRDGRRVTALDAQDALWEAADAYVSVHGFDAVGGDRVGALIMNEWRSVLDDLRTDPERTVDRVEWVAKQRLLRGYAERHGLALHHPRVAALALQYHDMRPERNLAGRLGYRKLVTSDAVAAAEMAPPETTRAYFRGECLRRFGAAVVNANWDSVVFDIGEPRLRRVPMLEPLRGTKATVGDVLAAAETPADLVAALGRT